MIGHDCVCDVLGPLPERWYVVDATGVATLCRDYDDAQDVAAECFVAWPQHGPHRVVMLGDVAAERERCAQLCDDNARRMQSEYQRTGGDEALHEATALVMMAELFRAHARSAPAAAARNWRGDTCMGPNKRTT